MTSQTHYYYTKVMTDLFYELPEVGPITTVAKHKCCLHQKLNKSTIIASSAGEEHSRILGVRRGPDVGRALLGVLVQHRQ